MPFNLSRYAQGPDAEYLDAVAKGDAAKAADMVGAAAKAAGYNFGPTLHGTPSRPSQSNNQWVRSENPKDEPYREFTVFNTQTNGVSDSGWLGRGTYFTKDESLAEEFGDRIMKCYLKMENPFTVPDDGSNSWDSYWQFKNAVKDLPGLPEELKINTELPPPRPVTLSDPSLKYDTAYVADYGDQWLVLREFTKEPVAPSKGGGVVAGKGRTRDEAVDNYNEGARHMSPGGAKFNPHGFILSVITKVIGAGRFTEMLTKAGYDSVIGKGEQVVFRPEQIKSAEAVTRDDSGQVIPLSKRFDQSSMDIRY